MEQQELPGMPLPDPPLRPTAGVLISVYRYLDDGESRFTLIEWDGPSQTFREGDWEPFGIDLEPMDDFHRMLTHHQL